MIFVHQARSFFAILTVALHVFFVGFCAIILQNRITDSETYFSTISVFLPVFGIYVGIVVKNIKLSPETDETAVSKTFIAIMMIILVAYFSGNIFVLYSYLDGFIVKEESLPGAIAFVEAAFGGFFTALFITLFQSSTRPT
jgi:hypothetical protein